MRPYLAIYTDMLLSLQLGNYRGATSLSKPLYIIAIINSIKTIENNRIYLDNKVIEQNFKELYHTFQGKYTYSRAAYIAPFFHLATSTFYHLIWNGKKEPPLMSSTPSAKYLREHLRYAKLDEELWELLQDAGNREYLRRNIIARYLPNNNIVYHGEQV